MFSFASKGGRVTGVKAWHVQGAEQVAGLRRGYAAKMEGVSSSQRCVRTVCVCVGPESVLCVCVCVSSCLCIGKLLK